MLETDFLLTGGSGFLGTTILRTLSSDYSIVTLGRGNESSILGDISSNVVDLKIDMKIKCVIHAAGKAHVVPKTNADAIEFFRVNLNATRNLCNSLSTLNDIPKEFIFISTVAVYGLEAGIMITEDQSLLGTSPYAKSKIEAENFLTQWCSNHKVKLTILRLPLVVGADPPGNLGAMIKWMRRGLYLGVGRGNANRSMVLAEDVAEFLPQVAQVGGVYNLTDGVNPSLAEFENALANRLGKSAPLRLPESLLKLMARAGDHMGKNFPLNSDRFNKLTSTLTFSDQKARTKAGWNGRNVLNNLPSLK